MTHFQNQITNHRYLNAPSLKWTGGAIALISLVAFGALLTLHLSGTLPLAYPASTFIPLGAGTLIGTALFSVCSRLERQTLPLSALEVEIEEEEEMANPPVERPPQQPTLAARVEEMRQQNTLRVAATRIFPEPLDAFGELVSNALDAARPDYPIGKFGMGFLSILAYLDLEETNGCEIKVTTTYKEEDLFHSYQLTITGNASHPDMNFEDLDPQAQTGTLIEILPNNNSFSEETLRIVEKSVRARRFYEHGKIKVNEAEIGTGEEVLAHVTLRQNRLAVEDYATGISMAVARGPLLTPSVSTKEARRPQTEAAIRLPEPIDHNPPYLFVVVEGVEVVSFPVPSRSLVLRLPASTSLTLARNAIEITPATTGYLRRLISHLLTGDINSEQLVTFYEALRAWEARDPNVYACGLSFYLKQHVQETLEERNLIAAPIDFFDQLPASARPKNAFPLHPELVNGNFFPLEEAIIQSDALSSPTCVEGVTVVFVPEEELPKVPGTDVAAVTPLGLHTILFAPASMMASPNVKTSLAQRASTAHKIYEPYKPRADSSPGTHLKSKQILKITDKLDRVEIDLSKEHGVDLLEKIRYLCSYRKAVEDFIYLRQEIDAALEIEASFEPTSSPIPSIYLPNFKEIYSESWRLIEAFVNYPSSKKILPFVSSLVLASETLEHQLANHSQLLAEWKNTLHTLLEAYHKFLISDAWLRLPENERIMMGPRTNDVALIDILSSLIPNPEAFTKLCRLMQEEALSYYPFLNVKSGRSSLPSNLKSFHSHHKNPTGLFVSVVERGLSKPLQMAILTSVANPEELFEISLPLSLRLPDDWIKKTDNGIARALTNVIRTELRPFLSRKTSRQRWIEASSTLLGIVSLKPLCKGRLILFFSVEPESTLSIAPPFMPNGLEEALVGKEAFTLRQLLTALPEQNLENLQLEAYTGTARNAEIDPKVQVINQCVQHGSERPGWTSFIIEATQNAIDAKAKEITYEVEVAAEGLAVRVADDAGMPSLKTFLVDFLVPNYSEKMGNANLVGEMGNGSFQMYRDAQMVLVKTKLVDTEDIFLHRVFPQRDENGEVVDLRIKTINLPPDETFKGTDIRVLFQNPKGLSPSELAVDGIQVREFLSSTIAMTHLEERPQLTLEHAGKKILLDGIDTEKDAITHQGMSFVPMKNNEHSGQVLTNGYPFGSLFAFLVQEKLLPEELVSEFHQGWCLNLSKEMYQPVQSRTRLILSKNVRSELKALIHHWIFYQVISEENPSRRERFFPHLNEETKFSQVYPSKKDYPPSEHPLNDSDPEALQSFFVNQRLGKRNFLHWINSAYSSLVPEVIEQKNSAFEKVLKATDQSVYDKLNATYRETIRTHFSAWKGEQLKRITTPKEKLFLKNVILAWLEPKIEFACQLPSFDTISRSRSSIDLEKALAGPRLQFKEKKRRKFRLRRKKKTSSTTPKTPKTPKTPLNEIKPLILNSANQNLSAYVKLYREIHKLNRPVQIAFATTHEPRKAWYADGTITINLFHFSLSTILTLGNHVAEGNTVNHDKKFQELIDTLDHELLHFQRDNSHKDIDAHKNGPDVDGKYVTFDEAAKSYGRRAAQAGLYDRWAEGCKAVDTELITRLIALEEAKPQAVAREILK